MRSHKMTTRSLSTAQKQQPRSGIAQSQQLSQSSRKKFPQLSRFPAEIRLMVWEEFLNDYEDNPPVAWTLIWGMDDPVNYADPTNIRLRPYISIERHCQNDRLVEYSSNPLLKVNLETRTAALHNQRYISIRAWKLDINIVVRPAMDYFFVDTYECQDIFSCLLPEFAAEYGNPTTFTLAEDMSFVKQAFALDMDWFEVENNKRHFDIAKNAPAVQCVWCAVNKLFNNCLGTVTTVVTHIKDEEEETEGGFDWNFELLFHSGLFSGSLLWPAWAFYCRHYQGMMLLDGEDYAYSPSPHGFISYLSVDIWSKICHKLMRHPVLEEDLQYSGDWDHIGEPRFGPRDLAGPKGSHLNLYKIYDYVRQSVKLAKTRRVKPRRPVRMLNHGRTLSEISGSFLRHQRPSETVELQTTCGAQCEHRVHKYLKKDGKTRSNGGGDEAGDGEQSSDAWLNWKYTWDDTSDEYTSDEDMSDQDTNDEDTNDEDTNDEDTNDEDTNDEDTNDEDTNDEDTNDEDTNDEDTNDEDHDVDDDDHAESSEENNDGYESLEL